MPRKTQTTDKTVEELANELSLEEPATQDQGADESEEASVVEDQSVEKHQTPAAEEVTAEAPAAEVTEPTSSVTVDDFITTLVIDPKARIKTPILVEHWHRWRAEHNPDGTVTPQHLIDAFTERGVETNKDWTYGAALPSNVDAGDFLSQCLFFHPKAHLERDELEAAFFAWWNSVNCPYAVTLNGIISAFHKRGVAPNDNRWEGVALRETEEDARRFPPCSVCQQATWRRQGGHYACHTCGATEFILNAKITKVVPLNDTHFYLYTFTRHVQVLAHVDRAIVPVYGIELQPGIQVTLTGRLKHAPIPGGDPGRFEFEISKMGSSIL